MTYVHPWYTQQSLLESTTTLELESTQRQWQGTPGPKLTDLHYHPLTDTIAAHTDGSVWTRWTKGMGKRKPELSNDWRKLTTYCGSKFRPRQSIAIPKRVADIISDNSNCRVLAGRFNLSCYLGRVLEDWEVCRHGSLGNGDHSKANLSVGCQLNNIVDSVIDGSIPTTRESVQQAIDRLTNYLQHVH